MVRSDHEVQENDCNFNTYALADFLFFFFFFLFVFCFGEANIFDSALHKYMPGAGTKEQIASLYSSSIKETKPYPALSIQWRDWEVEMIDNALATSLAISHVPQLAMVYFLVRLDNHIF